MRSINLVGVKCNLKERAESIEGIIEDRPLKDLIYPSAVITVEKILKE